MNPNHRELLSIALTLGIILSALFIIHRFLPSLAWAAIIVIASYPLYSRWKRFFGSWKNTSAFLFTLILSAFILLPLSWLFSLLIKEIQLLVNYLQQVNRDGGEAPLFFANIPLISDELREYWDQNVSRPGNVRELLSNIHLNLAPASFYIKKIGLNIVHRGFQLGFTLLTLFFFYRDGDALFKQINHVGEICLGDRWYRYAERLPAALRGTVNGTILVGLGVGVLMGVCYALVAMPAPTLIGFITAFAAMIPFVVPVVFGFVAVFLFATGNIIAAAVVIIWGTFVMFVADHFVKPVLIGGAIKLPFLAVLFGILGGVETLGLQGLFLGPMVMVLFMTLWYESQSGRYLKATSF